MIHLGSPATHAKSCCHRGQACRTWARVTSVKHHRVYSCYRCPFRPLVAIQNRKKVASWRPHSTRMAAATIVCALTASTGSTHGAKHATLSVPDQQLENGIPDSTSDKEEKSPNVCSPTSVFEIMVDVAQDPAVLELFYPYLPKDKRTYAEFQKAMAIETWRLQVLTGESQIRRSEILKHVRLAAPEPALLNQELTQLGFLSLVQH
ncbi:TPA: hypothetical protein ACH3X2_007607 [Trebouxia sp. C0005]